MEERNSQATKIPYSHDYIKTILARKSKRDTRKKKKKINTSVKLPRPYSRKILKNPTFEIQKSKNGKI